MKEKKMPDVAIVTGGMGSIGAAICAELQARGMQVVAADREAADVPAGQSFFACDVTDPDQVRKLFDHAATKGTLACVVVAHGVLAGTQPGAANPADVARVLDVNLKGAAFVCDQAGPRLGENGSILLISSATAFLGRIRNGYAYQASKGGLEAMMRAMAVAYAPRGIRVNVIAPGFMSVLMKGSEEMRKLQGGAETATRLVPLGRLVTPAEIAKAAGFLCSPDAATITGIVLPIDGGLSAS
jgi:3-oxoacyl-[acyl-carrier protein] reductase